MEKIYYPYPAKDGINKYYIITKSDKKIYFGAVGYFDFTLRKMQQGISNSMKNEKFGQTVLLHLPTKKTSL